ncbi:MAG: hypothetical protein H7061_06440, partial [Bdellovibrionaceae bacterium]|nr:hypothetical protein [Bdellovibrio sp.]
MQNVSAPHIVWLKALLLALIPILHFLICRYQTLPENDFHLRTQIFWSGMFGLFSLFISQAFYVFKTLRLSPRKSDPLIMAVTLVFADLLSKIFVNLITTLPPYFTWALISRSIAIAGIWYLVSHIFSFAVRAFKYQIRIGIFGTQKDIQYLAKSVRGYEAENFVHFSLVENNFRVNSYDIYAYSENSQHSDEQDYQLIQLIFHHAPLIDIRDIAEEFDSHVNLERTHISDVLTWARK